MNQRKHAHYYRNVSHLSEIDVYRVLDLFGVTDQALGHAIKKLLSPGGRGDGKDFRRDVQEAIDMLTRRLEMLDEDSFAEFDAGEPEFFASLATGDMELQAEAQHAATAPVVIPPAPDYLPDSVALDVTGNTASQAAPDGVAANAADDGLIPWGGGECPVKLKNLEMVDVKYRNGYRTQMQYPELQPWMHFGCAGDIIAYRVIKKESAA